MTRTFDRRECLTTVGAAALATALPVEALAAAPAHKPPVARVAAVKDTYFGETLSDRQLLKEPHEQIVLGKAPPERNGFDLQCGRIVFLDLQAPLGCEELAEVQMQDDMPAPGQFAAELNLERMPGIITDADSHDPRSRATPAL